MKIYGSYGVVNDVMKLLLAQTSWGAQAYEECSYPLGPDGTGAGFSVSDLRSDLQAGRACPNGAGHHAGQLCRRPFPITLTDAGPKRFDH